MVSIMRRSVYAFEKSVLQNSNLSFPNFSKPFILDTDASNFKIGAVRYQWNQTNVKQPIAYYSRSLSKIERKYAVTRKNMIALVDSLKHFRCYLLKKKFQVRTDYSALQ